MSGAAPEGDSASPPAKQDPESLVLRGRPRPVIRFRRGLIIGITGAVSASLVGLAWLALEPQSFRMAAEQERPEPVTKAAPEALSGAPASYADVPQLGPPLPGDLGRPILDQQRKLGGQSSESGSGAAAAASEAARAEEAEQQRLAAERQSARISAVLVQLGARARDGDAAPTGPPAAATGESADLATPGRAPAGQQSKIDFAQSASGDLNPHSLVAAPSPWVLSAGTIIPASLISGLNSDLPGIVLAQVTENVRDSATGRTLLIPQGARLIGRYDSAITYGQQRALLVWERIVFPDGSSLSLDKMPATDAAGYAGLKGHVNSHEWQLLKGVVLSTVLGLGSELSLGGSDIARAIRQSTQQSGTRAGEQLVGRSLDVQPTLVVRPGSPVRVLVDKDLVLEPWKG
ncbi:MAG: TrbI/VirB10 family protein [Sphingomicrobium sp.]